MRLWISGDGSLGFVGLLGFVELFEFIAFVGLARRFCGGFIELACLEESENG